MQKLLTGIIVETGELAPKWYDTWCPPSVNYPSAKSTKHVNRISLERTRSSLICEIRFSIEDRTDGCTSTSVGSTVHMVSVHCEWHVFALGKTICLLPNDARIGLRVGGGGGMAVTCDRCTGESYKSSLQDLRVQTRLPQPTVVTHSVSKLAGIRGFHQSPLSSF